MYDNMDVIWKNKIVHILSNAIFVILQICILLMQ
jgi:hypothetical protein